MARRSTLRILATVLGGTGVLLAIAGMYDYAKLPESANVVRFDQAEFVPNSARRPPSDNAPWREIILPDQWRNRPDISGTGWYRIKVALERAPTGVQAVFVRHRRAQRVSIFVNGRRVGTSRATNAEAEGRAGRGAEATLGMTVAPHLLRVGENVIHFRMEGSTHPAKIHGLGRVYFGDARPLRKLYVWMNELGNNAKRQATAMALAAGVITFFLWFARRSDRVMLWFSIACMFWGILGFVYTKLRWQGGFEARGMLYFAVTYSLVVPTLILSLRTVALKLPKLEIVLWAFFLIELSYPLWPGEPWPGALLVWDAINATLLFSAVGVILYAATRPLHATIMLQAGALAVMAAFMSYEIARYLGWVPVESPVMRHYHVPMMLLAMGAACFERHAQAIRQTTRMNIELEQRVAEKVHEIESNRARVKEVLRGRTLVNERQRILADMHDGLGATLVSLLRHVRAGGADPSSIKGRVQGALEDMRAAIAALQPRDGDIGAVLASLRERLDSLIAGSGMGMIWRVDELPVVAPLNPSAAFSVQRIVLEAVGNALKHSDANEIRVVACGRGSGEIEIRVEDNGKGFDPGSAHSGLGLGNMRARSEQIGAALQISASPGSGTVVRLIIPNTVQAGSAEQTEAAFARESAALLPAARAGIVMMTAAASIFFAVHSPFAGAAFSPQVFEFHEADFVVNGESFPPSEKAPWKRVFLPDQWRYHTEASSAGWYRLKFTLDNLPKGVQSITVPHRRAYRVAFFVNDKLVGTAHDHQSMAGSEVGALLGSAMYFLVSRDLLRVGENVIHVRMKASPHPALFHGLGSLYFGDSRAVRRIYNRFNELGGFAVRRDFTVMTLAAGLIALFIWLARPMDRVTLWFSVTCLSWGGMGFVYLMWRWSDLTIISSLLHFYTVYGLVTPVVILSLRTVDLKWPRIETGLWVLFAIELTYPFWATSSPAMLLVWNVANSGLLAGAIGVILYAVPRPMHWTIRLQVTALTTMALVMSYGIVRYLGWVDVDSAEIRHFHVPIMLVAMGAVCFERYARAIRQAERTTIELEQCVVEKVREIEANHAQLEEAHQEYILSQERQRILNDVHDGLGASLVSLLRYIDTGRAELATIERRVQEALQEMRVAIDALQPRGGDLGAVLGSLRERLDGLLSGSGIRLAWQVDELPKVKELTPSAVFSLQRIVLEAAGNALKYSWAKEIRFVAGVGDGGGAAVRIQDDGRGFDVAKVWNGPGLTNMRVRAERIGAKFDITSQLGQGTVVQLTIPRAAPASASDRAESETESAPMRPPTPAIQIG